MRLETKLKKKVRNKTLKKKYLLISEAGAEPDK